MEIESLLNRSELRRLQRASKEKNISEIVNWAIQFEKVIKEKYYNLYKEELEKQIKESLERYMIVIIYTLHFNEKLQFDEKVIDDFMKDLMATLRAFDRDEYTLEEYKKMLKDDNILYFDK